MATEIIEAHRWLGAVEPCEGHDLHDAAVDLAYIRAGSIMGTPESSNSRRSFLRAGLIKVPLSERW